MDHVTLEMASKTPNQSSGIQMECYGPRPIGALFLLQPQHPWWTSLHRCDEPHAVHPSVPLQNNNSLSNSPHVIATFVMTHVEMTYLCVYVCIYACMYVVEILLIHQSPLLGGITPYVASWITMINIKSTGSHSRRYTKRYGRYFFLFLFFSLYVYMYVCL